MRVTLALLCVLLSVPVAAQTADLRPMRLALAGYGVASAVDRTTTAYWIGSGHAQEVGVLRLTDHPVAWASAGAAVDVGVGYALYHLSHRSRTTRQVAFWTTVGLTVAKTVIVARNARRIARAS